MAKRGKMAAKKSAKRSTKASAKRATAGQKRTSARTVPSQQMTFIDHFLKIFAQPKTRKT
jgi:hypothetical protein